jgi:hypothetical protein
MGEWRWNVGKLGSCGGRAVSIEAGGLKSNKFKNDVDVFMEIDNGFYWFISRVFIFSLLTEQSISLLRQSL